MFYRKRRENIGKIGRKEKKKTGLDILEKLEREWGEENEGKRRKEKEKSAKG